MTSQHLMACAICAQLGAKTCSSSIIDSNVVRINAYLGDFNIDVVCRENVCEATIVAFAVNDFIDDIATCYITLEQHICTVHYEEFRKLVERVVNAVKNALQAHDD